MTPKAKIAALLHLERAAWEMREAQLCVTLPEAELLCINTARARVNACLLSLERQSITENNPEPSR